MATVISTRTTDMFEQLFQRLEQESELRALAEQDYRSDPAAEVDAAGTTGLHVIMQEITEVVEEEYPDLDPSQAPDSSLATTKERRRGSISISRFGQTTAEHTPAASHLPSTRPSRSSSLVSKAPFYQLDLRQPRVYTSSADSFASMSFPDSDPSIHNEDTVESSMFFEPGKRSISKAFARRLSRAKESSSLLPSASFISESLVIGIAVEEATVEHRADNGECHSAENVSTTQVYTGTLRSRRSTPGLYQRASAVHPSPSSWMSKAKDITSRLRRKSLAALTNAGTVALR